MDHRAIIHADRVSKYYGANNAIKQVSFQVKHGEIFGIIGKNGAGKSTLLELLSGNLMPDEGSLSVHGYDMRVEGTKLKEHINIFSQSTSLVDRLMVREALDMFSSFYNRQCDIDAIMKQFGLFPYADKIVRRLSGGLRQRTTLAIAVVNDPSLIFLDEPTTGLDAQSKKEYWAILSSLKLQGKTIVIVSHDLSEMQYHCDRIGILREGRFVACDAPTQLIREHPSGGLTMEAVYMHYAVGEAGGVEV